MIVTCKTCKKEIEVKAWAPMTEGYICPVCQAKYERCFYLHLVRRRIEKMATSGVLKTKPVTLLDAMNSHTKEIKKDETSVQSD